MGSQKDYQLLESHIESNETAIDAEEEGEEGEDNGRKYLLTDRRLLWLTRSDRGRETITVKSLFLDAIGTVSVKQQKSKEYDEGYIVLGAMLGILGFFSIAFMGQAESEVQSFLLVAGLSLGVLAAVVVYEGLQTKPGYVKVTIKSAEGERTFEMELAGGKAEFAKAISKTASASHSPAKTPTRTVG
ncbi:hypothetical protein C479_11345 [Halovivax asiaticus JCM 14624]|uniref:Uncharacterized protein n=1 Tax=Halovivax asiaticus JCM 14624 TaxID=1227490 RepID=M0BEU4_9EURY|nr:hypothetical protein [Halovivax asiaticus]ELZ09411.1 hypothetical protein C479_11345 [Halovivax asiaticus JCM 14624]